MTGSLLDPLVFGELPGWAADDHRAAFRTFRAGAPLILETAPKTRGLGVDGKSLQAAARTALHAPEPDRAAARGFFERHFILHRIAAPGFVTAYYEPEVAASATQSERFRVPLYRRPDDLVEVAEAERPAGWDPDMRFARRGAAGLEPYPDRAAVEAGALAGRGLELAWVADPVDAFFIHVQGSARLKLAGDGTMRISFDGKSGHPYTSIGRLAVERGMLDRNAADKEGLERWLKANRPAGRALMRENRSFIFFRQTELGDGDGPLGAAGIPLTPGRSLAVDRALHTFGSPIWVHAPGVPDPDGKGGPFRRLLIAQDTGSAIVGPARGDLFFGSGESAGALAGRVRHPAAMVLLAPAEPARTS